MLIYTYRYILFASDIKIRGNSTAGAEKKPYNFKLSKKQELLGMKGKAKKWPPGCFAKYVPLISLPPVEI